MSLTSQQQNFVSELMDWAEGELRQRDKGRNLVARWALNGILAKLTDEDIQAVASFAHLDAAGVIAGVTALQVVNDALGDDVSGQATNLIRMKG